MEFHQNLRQRNFDARMKALKLEQWSRFAKVNVVLGEDKENAINGRAKEDSDREETCSNRHDED